MKLATRLLDFAITPCLVDGEAYALQTRKLFVIALAAITFNALLLGLPITILNGLYDPSVGAYIVGAAFFQVTVTSSIIPYLYLRTTKTLPAWLPDLQVWSIVPITLMMTLFSHQSSVIVVNGIMTLVGVVLQVRGWLVMLIYSIVIIIFHALINDFAEEIPILRETFYSTQILPVKLLYLLGTVVTPQMLLGLGLWYIMSRFSERMDQADAAIAMNLAVADKLRRYDTDGVAEILAANKGKVDENLLTAFAAIQHNLQEYRPHIPDYVIEATMDDVVTDDDEDDGFGECAITQPQRSVLQGVEDDDEGDQIFEMSESLESGERVTPNRNASFFGSCSSTGTPRRGSSSHNNSSAFANSTSLKIVTGNTPTIGAVGGGWDPSIISPRASLTNVAFMGSSANNTIPTHDTSTTTACHQGGRLGGRTSSGLRMGHRLMIPTVQVNGCQNTRQHGAERYVSDAMELSSETNTSMSVDGGTVVENMAASKISSANGRGGKGGGKHGGAKGGGGGASKTYTGRATTVFIRFIAGTCGSVRGTDGSVRGSQTSTVVELLGLGVEAASKMAKSHGGAVQYMQGCGLMVSFNAASRVLAHESKACAFALGLKTEMDALRRTPLTMHATIVTTPVMSFFAGNKGQLVLTVLGGYMPIHTALHHYLSQTVGDDVSCILISKSTIPNIELHYESRMLGVLGMSPSEDVGSTGVASGQKGGHVKSMNIHSDVIQLVCPRKATASDEWMYELENQTSTHGFTKMIVDTAASGDLQAAMRIVNEHEAAIHNDTLLSRCLHDRIESCIEDSTAFPLHTTPPTKMW